MKKKNWWVAFEKVYYAGIVLILGAVIAGFEEQFTTYLILLTSIFVVRLVVRWKVSRMMSAKSSESHVHELEELNADEVDSGSKLTILEIDAISSQPFGEAEREVLVSRARKLFRLGLLRDTIAMIAYLVVTLIFEDENYLGMEYPPAPILAIFTLIIIFSRFLFFRSQFRPLDANFSHPETHPTLLLVRELSRASAYPFIVAGVLLYCVYWNSDLHIPSFAATLGIIALHMMVLWHWTPDPHPNIRLLVLRVFGIDKNATFTFGRLLEYWQHFGNYFTVVDPSYLKYHYRFWSPRTGVVVAVLWAIVGSVYFWPEAFGDSFASIYWRDSYGVALSAVVATVLVIIYEIIQIDRRMVRGRDDLRHKLVQLNARPRSYDMTFKALPTPCYDDTWRVAVAEFVQVTDVVLMDLRGFSEERKGCEYEVDFLFDVVPLKRILFLVDADIDRELIRRLVVERWEKLRLNSPNLGADNPVIHIYAAHEQDELDVQMLIDQLIGMAVAGCLDIPATESLLDPTIQPASNDVNE